MALDFSVVAFNEDFRRACFQVCKIIYLSMLKLFTKYILDK